MKRIILLSSFVLTQTLFATTLTIYNSNMALIQESQTFSIKQNSSDLILESLPDTLLDNSVDVTFPSSVSLEWQTYRPKRYKQHKKETINSRLTLHVKSTKELKADLDISYLAKNISFATDYILNIDKNRAQFSAYVDIQNNSGKDFKNASINLIAGSINRAYNHPQPVMYRAMASDKALPSHKAVAGYHKYSLPMKIDLNSYEKQRVKFFDTKEIALTSSYIATMNNPLYLMGERSSSVKRELHLEALKHELPAGLVRIYTTDEKEKLLLGEAGIANTPKNSPLTLSVGQDFDTKVTQKILSRNDTNTQFDATVLYSIINTSNEDKIVTLHIPFNKKSGSHINSKLKYTYTKGNLVTFTLKVKANSQRSFDVNFKSSRR